MHRTRNSLAKVIGVALLGTAFAALGAGGAQALPLVPGVSVAQAALQNSPVAPARASSEGGVAAQNDQSGASAVVAGIPLSSKVVPLPMGG